MHSKSRLSFCILALYLLSAGSVFAEDALSGLPEPFELGESLSVSEVIDGNSLLLEDGQLVRLAGIQAPRAPVGAEPEVAKTWPLSLAAATTLAALIGDDKVTLAYSGRRLDRHGRILAHATNAAGQWLQAALLRKGLARVDSYPDNRTGVSEMLALESQARREQLGLWRHPLYAVRRAEDAEQDVGTFQLIEGRVLKVAIVGGRAYLNFGEDWRSDFTLVIEPAQRRQFEAEGLDPRFFEGRRVRARGWLGYRNGATITVTHPEQIEVLDR